MTKSTVVPATTGFGVMVALTPRSAVCVTFHRHSPLLLPGTRSWSFVETTAVALYSPSGLFATTRTSTDTACDVTPSVLLTPWPTLHVTTSPAAVHAGAPDTNWVPLGRLIVTVALDAYEGPLFVTVK